MSLHKVVYSWTERVTTEMDIDPTLTKEEKIEYVERELAPLEEGSHGYYDLVVEKVTKI